MFSALRQGSLIYILLKRNPIELKLGQVSHVNSNTSYALPNYSVDISVNVDNVAKEFKQLPGLLSIAYYDNGNTVVSDSKDSIITEVENMIKNSQEIINNIPYYKEVLASGEEMLKSLSPLFALLKDQEQKITNLETKVGSMESKLDNITSMLTKALEK